jgi:putative inorganic carbon (HCO3(-)) transporter
MLRTIFVLSIVIIGTYYALQAPFYSLLFYLWYAYFRPEDWVWTDFIKNFHLSFIIGCYVLMATIFSRSRLVFNARTVLILIFLIHTLISTLFSENFGYSWLYWKDFLRSIIISYLIIVLVDDFAKFRLVILIIVLALGFEGAKQGWVYLFTSPEWPNTNQIAFLGDNNGVAVGMLMLIPMIALLAQTTMSKCGRWFYFFLLLGVLFRALSTHSRGGFLASLAVGGAYWLSSRHKLRSLAAVGIIATIVVATLPETFWSRMHTIQTFEEEEDRSALGRLHFWEVALAMAKAHPVLGVGYNAYNLAYDDYDFSKGQYGHQR